MNLFKPPVPRSVLQSCQIFQELSGDQRQTILQLLDRVGACYSKSALADEIASTTGIESGVAKRFILGLVRMARDTDIDYLEGDYVESLGEETLMQLRIARASHFATIVSKAESLNLESESVLIDTSVLTDIRPVFDDEVGAPLALSVIHSLKLEYRSRSQAFPAHVATFLRMDSSDLKSLRDSIDRALKKEDALLTGLSVNAGWTDRQ